MIYRVGLSEYKDGLTRRPAATWTIIKLDSEIDDVTCYVTSVEEKDPEQQATPGQVRQLLHLSTSTRHFPNQTSRGQSLVSNCKACIDCLLQRIQFFASLGNGFFSFLRNMTFFHGSCAPLSYMSLKPVFHSRISPSLAKNFASQKLYLFSCFVAP